jgi:hypothetical protein
MRTLLLFIMALAGCTERVPESRVDGVSFSGRPATALIYGLSEDNRYLFLCSATYVALEGSPARMPGLLTATHCFTSGDPSIRGHYASFDEGANFLRLGRAWLGEERKAADIAFVELDAQDAARAGAVTPLAVSLQDSEVAEGEQVWAWGNPDNQGIALTVGRIMRTNLREKPNEAEPAGQDPLFDQSGYLVIDMTSSPGSSGGLLMAERGAVGVFSTEALSADGAFKTLQITPIARLGPVLSQPPLEKLPIATPPRPTTP